MVCSDGRMQKILHLLKAPLYFQWLILFFVLHGYSEFIGHIQLSSLALLIVKLSAVAWLLFFIFRRMYRDAYKSALLVTVLFFCYLFFGAMQDKLAAYPPLFSWSLFRKLIPVLGVLCLLVAISLFFSKTPPPKFTRFLNGLFIIYILFDIGSITWRAINMEQKPPVAVQGIRPLAGSVTKPDVYLILLDEYLGSAGLQEYYHYDNTPFESFLKQKGFHVCSRPASNYAFTIYSMASLFNMRYLDSTDLGHSEGYTYKSLAALINKSAVSEYFKQFNYSIHNYSPFVFAGTDATESVSVLPRDIELITDQAAYSRLLKRIVLGEPQDKMNLAFVARWLNKKIDATHERQMKAVLEAAHKPSTQSPAFTYLHLLMPHKPFIYDSTGKTPDVYATLSGGNRISGTDKLYLQYLVYTNKRISRFIDELYTATRGKAAIIVMSDHGYRDARSIPGKDFSFQPFNAVYLPNRDYHLWYDSVSNVNQFPLLFNTLFGQQIPLKKDSTHF
jgi:hypothetical protein